MQFLQSIYSCGKLDDVSQTASADCLQNKSLHVKLTILVIMVGKFTDKLLNMENRQ